jgi:hypothetical protein
MKSLQKILWIVIFSVAMGYLESSVVVYLRELYYPEGFNFPLRAMAQDVAVTELFREAATLIMILSVSILAADFWLHRFAWFLVIFGIWDIAYYVFLKFLLGWPESLFTTDILFLLPSIWTGPVIAPVINSLTMILVAAIIMKNRKGAKPLIRLTGFIWFLLIAGSMVILIGYMKDFTAYAIEIRHSLPSDAINQNQNVISLSTQFVPRSFDWLLFSSGVCLHILAIYLIIIRKRKGSAIV